MSRRASSGVRGALEGDEVREILRESFFTPPTGVTPPPPPPPAPPAVVVPQGEPEDAGAAPGASRRTSPQRAVKPRPEHYKVICISMYTEDLARLDAAVRELKRRGYTKANRSAVLRVAMEQLNLDRIPKGL
jgi:hypothetical protein